MAKLIIKRREEIEAEDLAARRTLINQARDAHATSTFPYLMTRFDCDEKSVAKINGMASYVNSGSPLPPDFTWTDANDVDVPMGPEQIIGLQAALVAHVNECHKVARQLKARLDAGHLVTEKEIEEAPWP